MKIVLAIDGTPQAPHELPDPLLDNLLQRSGGQVKRPVRLGQLPRHLFPPQEFSRGENGQSLDEIFQLPHVSFPGMGSDHLQRLFRERAGGPGKDRTVLLEEKIGEKGDILPSLGKGGYADRENVQPVEKVSYNFV